VTTYVKALFQFFSYEDFHLILEGMMEGPNVLES
jgi:hypothetical protein